MRHLWKISLAVFAVALLVGPAMAQRPGGGFGGPMSVSQLLTNKSVQEELKLDKDQIAKIEEVTKKYRDDNKAEYDKIGRGSTLSREEQAELRRKLGEGMTKVINEAKVLKEDQSKRLRQIQIQQMGLAAFSEEDVQKALKLDDKTKDTIKTITEDVRKDAQKLFADAGMDFQKLREIGQKVQEMNKEAREKVEKLLSEDQKKALKELQGEKFEIKFERPRPPQNSR